VWDEQIVMNYSGHNYNSVRGVSLLPLILEAAGNEEYPLIFIQWLAWEDYALFFLSYRIVSKDTRLLKNQ